MDENRTNVGEEVMLLQRVHSLGDAAKVPQHSAAALEQGKLIGTE